MRASGNGNVAVCANNLLLTFRGEVPYERVKGIDPRLIDRPIALAEADLQQDAAWLLETYEPRADIRGIRVEQSDAAGGSFNITADIREKEV